MDSKVWKKLPEDCWIPILNALGQNYTHLEFISLVSRQFLSITNQLRRSLTITNEIIPFLPKLLCRFPNIDEINIPCCYFLNGHDLYVLLRQISAFNSSKIQSSLRILNCPGMLNFKDDALVSIANTFVFLEELNISNVSRVAIGECLSDAGIRQMSLHLKQLRKINISGNRLLTDQSIISLSSNCLLLEELGIRCRVITMKGIGMALRDCHYLNSISAFLPSTDEDKDFFSKSLAYATNLRELDLDFQYAPSSIADAFLTDLAEANLPLEKLKLRTVYGTYKGFSYLLHKYHSLVSLDVGRSGLLTSDQNVADISKFLKNITYINLNGCFNLTSLAFFTIIKSCPFLSNICMQSTNVGGIEEFDETDFVVNGRVKILGLAGGGGNTKMCDEFLKKVAFTCPNLENLELAGCYGGDITVEGINTILRNCHEIRHLDISFCYSIREFNIDIQLPNLQVFLAKKLHFDDKSLEIIGQRCNGLLRLDLEDCYKVSANGLMDVAKKCRKLRKINLQRCNHSNT